MGKRRSCDGRPHRAVQNQAFCCTGRPRRTVRCRKWPCGVREARLSIGGCARQWQQEQVRRNSAVRTVADDMLTIKQKSTLPVSKTRQDKSLFFSLPGTYPPPGAQPLCPSALQPPRPHGLPSQRRQYYPPPAPACARRPFCTTTCAAATAAPLARVRSHEKPDLRP